MCNVDYRDGIVVYERGLELGVVVGPVDFLECNHLPQHGWGRKIGPHLINLGSRRDGLPVTGATYLGAESVPGRSDLVIHHLKVHADLLPAVRTGIAGIAMGR